MVQSVDAVCFPLINYATFKEEVVTILERDDLLLLVGVEWRVGVVNRGEFVVPCIPNHVVGEVRHRPHKLLILLVYRAVANVLLLGRDLLLLLLLAHVNGRAEGGSVDHGHGLHLHSLLLVLLLLRAHRLLLVLRRGKRHHLWLLRLLAELSLDGCLLHLLWRRLLLNAWLLLVEGIRDRSLISCSLGAAVFIYATELFIELGLLLLLLLRALNCDELLSWRLLLPKLLLRLLLVAGLWRTLLLLLDGNRLLLGLFGGGGGAGLEVGAGRDLTLVADERGHDLRLERILLLLHRSTILLDHDLASLVAHVG